MKLKLFLFLSLLIIFIVFSTQREYVKNLSVDNVATVPDITEIKTTELATKSFILMPTNGNPFILKANEYILSHLIEFHISDNQKLIPSLVSTPLGAWVSYSMVQDGFPVLGISLSLFVDSNGLVTKIENGMNRIIHYKSEQPISVSEVISQNAESIEIRELDKPITTLYYLPPNSNTLEKVYALRGRERNGKTGNFNDMLFRQSDGQLIARQVPRKEF